MVLEHLNYTCARHLVHFQFHMYEEIYPYSTVNAMNQINVCTVMEVEQSLAQPCSTIQVRHAYIHESMERKKGLFWCDALQSPVLFVACWRTRKNTFMLSILFRSLPFNLLCFYPQWFACDCSAELHCDLVMNKMRGNRISVLSYFSQCQKNTLQIKLEAHFALLQHFQVFVANAHILILCYMTVT